MATILRWGLIGAGSVQIWHAERLKGLADAAVVAVADPDPASRERFVARTGLQPTLYADHRDLLRDPAVDVVLVGTPHALHAGQVLDALAAGKHVLCEKPLANSRAEAVRLAEAARRAGRVLMVSYQRHADPRFRYIYDQIAGGALGRLTFIAGFLAQEWLRGTAGTWRQDPAQSGGGELHDSGSHLVDMLLWWGGPVVEVFAVQDRRGTAVDINTALTLRFASGALGSLTIVGDTQCWQEDWTLSGEAATIFYRNGALRVSRSLHQAPEAVPEDALPETPGIEAAFQQAVRGEAPVLVPPEVGVQVMAVTEAAWASAQSGRPVAVPAP
jgi:predicted dehydrogenase